MLKETTIAAIGKALREHDMKGRITLSWEKVPNSQKKKWLEKGAVAYDAAQSVLFNPGNAPIGAQLHVRKGAS